MNIGDFKNNFSFLQKSNYAMYYTNAILATLLTGSLFMNTQKDTIVINGLSESCEQTLMSKSSMNEANHKRYGFYLSGMLGNITPDTAEFVKGAVMPFVAPDIYHKVSEAIDIQIGGLVEDKLTISFTPERALLEDGITYITGRTVITGPAGDREGSIRTYEFKFDVDNYTPLATYLTVYDDVAHDREWQAKHTNN